MVNDTVVFKLVHEVGLLVVKVRTVWLDADISIPELLQIGGAHILDGKYIQLDLCFPLVLLEEDVYLFLLDLLASHFYLLNFLSIEHRKLILRARFRFFIDYKLTT